MICEATANKRIFALTFIFMNGRNSISVLISLTGPECIYLYTHSHEVLSRKKNMIDNDIRFTKHKALTMS